MDNCTQVYQQGVYFPIAEKGCEKTYRGSARWNDGTEDAIRGLHISLHCREATTIDHFTANYALNRTSMTRTNT